MSVFLVDTHLLPWAAGASAKLPAEAHALMADPASTLVSSTASLWEIVIQSTLGREDFRVDARRLRRGPSHRRLSRAGDRGTSRAGGRPAAAHHRDPSNRVLVAQAQSEGAVVLTADAVLEPCGDAVRLVR